MTDPSTQMQMEPGMEPGMMPPTPEPVPEPEPDPVPEPEPGPMDPTSIAIIYVMSMDGQESVRRVYQLATSAARAKAKIDAAADRLDAKGYHDMLSQLPEARYAKELVAGRRRLDTLAQERRRLNLEMVKSMERNARSAIVAGYELQIAGLNLAMEQVAGGMLLFLALPDTPQAPPPPPPPPMPEPGLEPELGPGLHGLSRPCVQE